MCGVQQQQGTTAACVDRAMAGTRIRVEWEVPVVGFTGIIKCGVGAEGKIAGFKARDDQI